MIIHRLNYTDPHGGYYGESDGGCLIGYFSSPEKLEEAKKAIETNNSKVLKNKTEFDRISDNVKELTLEYAKETPKPVEPERMKGKPVAHLCSYINEQRAKGNLEQVEATKLELKDVEKENADRNRAHTDQLRVYREEVKKYNEARDKYIILRIGQQAFDFYSKPPSFQRYEGLSVVEIQLDKYNL